jgi:hypothetical protein
MNRLSGSLFMLLAVTGSAPAADPKEPAKEQVAALRTRALVAACESYAANPANEPGQYPEKLTELDAPRFQKASFLKNGKKDLLDPWGKEFKYELVEAEKGAKVPYVWAERDVDGKTKVYGQAPPKKKS